MRSRHRLRPRGTLCSVQDTSTLVINDSKALIHLAGNLDTTLTLTRKKSGWFGSARETLARGALSAKGYIDSIRGEGSVRGEDE
jgi:hypothetical protein